MENYNMHDIEVVRKYAKDAFDSLEELLTYYADFIVDIVGQEGVNDLDEAYETLDLVLRDLYYTIQKISYSRDE